MSDLKRLLERSLREKEPDDFVDLPAKVEEFIRENKVDESAGKQLRIAHPKAQKEVIHRGSLSGCKNPSAVCLARIREEKKLLGDAATEHHAFPAPVMMPAMAVTHQVHAQQQIQVQQQMMMASMSMSSQTLLPNMLSMGGIGGVLGIPAFPSLPVAGLGIGGATCLPGIGHMPGIVGMPFSGIVNLASPLIQTQAGPVGAPSPQIPLQTASDGTESVPLNSIGNVASIGGLPMTSCATGIEGMVGVADPGLLYGAVGATTGVQRATPY